MVVIRSESLKLNTKPVHKKLSFEVLLLFMKNLRSSIFYQNQLKYECAKNNLVNFSKSWNPVFLDEEELSS